MPWEVTAWYNVADGMSVEGTFDVEFPNDAINMLKEKNQCLFNTNKIENITVQRITDKENN